MMNGIEIGGANNHSPLLLIFDSPCNVLLSFFILNNKRKIVSLYNSNAIIL